MRSKKTKHVTLFSFFLAVELIMLFTPLGFLRIGPISATLLHIPVILSAILLGWKYGVALGFIFGLCSIWNATFVPGPTSFCFSPFITVGGISGNFMSVMIAIIPRILLGLFSAFAYQAFTKRNINKTISIICSTIIGTITNTVLVLGMIYVFFGASYAVATSISYNVLLSVLLGIIFTNGLAEASIGSFLVLMIVKAVRPTYR